MKFHSFSYTKKLLINFSVVFVLYAILFIVFQYQREEQYKIDILKTELRSYADLLANYEFLNDKVANDTLVLPLLNAFPKDVRIAVFNLDGTEVYVSNHATMLAENLQKMQSEVLEAMKEGEDYFVAQMSTQDGDFFCYAKAYSDRVVCLSLPYDATIQHLLKPDNIFFWFSLLIFPIVLLLLIQLSDHFGKSVTMLRLFIESAERGLVDYNHIKFPNSELGRIGQTILGKYKQLEETHKAMLKEKEKRKIFKRDMSNNIAHELRTPVSSISGFLETIIASPNLSEERRLYFLKRAHAQTQRLTAIIRDISIISKVDEAPESMTRDRVCINHVVAEVLEELHQTIKEKQAKVVCDLPENTILNGNYSLIHAIFRNLLENALRYAGEEITINFSLTGENTTHYFFSFYDNGCGVDEQCLPRIFERFYRVQEGRTRHFNELGGTGLGLSIVKNAVLFHYGEIKASNRKESGLQYDFSLARF
jgi:signal transduction histidine kinase